MDKVFVKNLILFSYHGVTVEEKQVGRQFRINIVAKIKNLGINDSDSLSATVNYVRLTSIAKEVCCQQKRNLIETVALEIAERVLNELALVKKIKVTVEKMNPPIGEIAESSGITITRSRVS